MSDLVEPKQVDVVYETDQPVLYEVIDGVAWVTHCAKPSRPNSRM